ncbi:Mitogen-activated protein kinase kinase kinase 1, putative isoform 1 [Hibiscus syriacus]|uniref:Mitogen-activated protein kinase kinase kinase 1, putative isoform 1 n=1 Tax=Hibiscus syriacus TaxID=106335 RepID=A0A6A2XX04_HIBSY|nr:uncharacterized protein LOC120169114 [Hibiscus syriacus]KAE8674560.1 Mitogen-activated protein kinase kinase kinase 1, putative isoform 1 [Hibiscus syriacus]
MESREPTLVPEWLRSNSTVTGGGNSAHNFASSSSHSDFSSGHHGKHRNSRNISDFDSHRSTFLERTSSLNSRRSSSNGSAKHAYSSFSRNHHDRDRDRDKVRLNFGDHQDHAASEPLESLLTGRVEIETLHRSNSMFSRKQGEPLPRKVGVDSRDSINSNHNNDNVLLSGVSVGSSIHKVMFERDFPSLGTEDRQVVPEIARVSSPGLSSASQNLPIGSSALISGNGWTTALAEAPSVVGSNNTGSLTTPLTISISCCLTPTGSSGLNMAEALAHAPSLSHTSPQLSVKIQRREELAIKQSKQLIPVTHSMPKGSVLNSVDKSKGKPAVRTSEINISVKSGQQQPSLIHHGNQSPRGGHVKSDMLKTSGKLLVLKPGWENGVSSPTHKDVSPTSVNSKVTVSTQAVGPTRNSNSPKLSAGERKVAASNSVAGFTVEKRPSLSQTQSRNDFFNLLKKTASAKTSASHSDSNPHISSSMSEKSEVTKEIVNDSSTAHVNENGTAATSNGAACQEAQSFADDDGEKNMGSASMIHPDEEEAAFLRSLGWEENSGEDEGLTEEEINAFYQECMKLRPSLKLCRGMQPKLAQSFATNLDGAASELSSSDSGSKA